MEEDSDKTVNISDSSSVNEEQVKTWGTYHESSSHEIQFRTQWADGVVEALSPGTRDQLIQDGEIEFKTPMNAKPVDVAQTSTSIKEMEGGEDCRLKLELSNIEMPEATEELRPLIQKGEESDIKKMMEFMMALMADIKQDNQNVSKQIGNTNKQIENTNKQMGEMKNDLNQNFNKQIGESNLQLSKQIGDTNKQIGDINKQIGELKEQTKQDYLIINQKFDGFKQDINQIKSDMQEQRVNIERGVDERFQNYTVQQNKEKEKIKGEINKSIQQKCKESEKVMKEEIDRGVAGCLAQGEERIEEFRHETRAWEGVKEKKMEENFEKVRDDIGANRHEIKKLDQEVEKIYEKTKKVEESLGNMGATPVTVQNLILENRADMPLFPDEKGDLVAPVFLGKIKHYFDKYQVPQGRWLVQVAQCFNGISEYWYREVKSSCSTWDVFEDKFMQHFHNHMHRVQYATMFNNRYQEEGEKANRFIWEMRDLAKWANPEAGEKEMITNIVIRMTAGFAELLGEDIVSIQELVAKAEKKENIFDVKDQAYYRNQQRRRGNQSYQGNQNNNSRGGYYSQNNSRQNYDGGRGNNNYYKGGWYNNGNNYNTPATQPPAIARVSNVNGGGTNSTVGNTQVKTVSPSQVNLNASGSAAQGQTVTPTKK